MEAWILSVLYLSKRASPSSFWSEKLLLWVLAQELCLSSFKIIKSKGSRDQSSLYIVFYTCFLVAIPHSFPSSSYSTTFFRHKYCRFYSLSISASGILINTVLPSKLSNWTKTISAILFVPRTNPKILCFWFISAFVKYLLAISRFTWTFFGASDNLLSGKEGGLYYFLSLFYGILAFSSSILLPLIDALSSYDGYSTMLGLYLDFWYACSEEGSWGI